MHVNGLTHRSIVRPLRLIHIPDCPMALPAKCTAILPLAPATPALAQSSPQIIRPKRQRLAEKLRRAVIGTEVHVE
jgi:hypothetical protein